MQRTLVATGCMLLAIALPVTTRAQSDGVTSRVAAEEFRVETDVFRDQEDAPIVRTLTLFTEGPIYDFQLDDDHSQQITIYDLPRNRFLLLDVPREIKTTISVQQVLQACLQVKSLVSPDDELLYFSANPAFEAEYQEATGWLTLTGKPIVYRVKGAKPRYRSAARRYQDFADWSARLNCLIGVGLAPQARVEVNRQTAERLWIPEQVERSLTSRSLLGTTQVARTNHRTTWQLSSADRKRIDQAGNLLANYREVSLPEFRQSLVTASN